MHRDESLKRTALTYPKNYARLRTLLDRWIELGSRLCDLRLEQRDSE